MFQRINVPLVRNPQCTRAVDNLTPNAFRYYDKDGFELCQAEQRYYEAENHPIEQPILNHRLWQEEWMTIEHPRLHFDHAMILHRCSYDGEAREQLEELKSTIPQADLLLRTRQQWGYDFDLDYVAESGQIFEVLHIECDFNNFAEFEDELYKFEDSIERIDFEEAARSIWRHRDEWDTLTGFSQNDWKANHLLGWEKAEYTEKAL